MNKKAQRAMKSLEPAALQKAQSSEIAKPYAPTPEERRAVAALRKSKSKLRLTVKEGNTICFEHPDQLHAAAVLMERLATTNEYLLGGILTQLSAVAMRKGKIDGKRLNYLISAITGIGPKDELETLLATQMAAIHALTLDYASQLNNSETIPQGISLNAHSIS